ALQGITPSPGYVVRHDTLGWWFWEEEMAHTQDEILDPWLQAIMGHHGQPPLAVDHQNRAFKLLGSVTSGDRQAIHEYWQAVNQFLPVSSRPSALPRSCRPIWRRFSWWLAGLTVLADWLGSDQELFPFVNHSLPLVDYWQRAQQLADKAVHQAGLVYSAIAPTTDSFHRLFPHLSGQEPTPLQQLAGTVSLGEGARLFIVEDLTGAGKTEAAMVLIHRLLASGASDGFYVAMPTMATANAMYQRVGEIFRRLFQEDASLVLAHGARHSLDSFRRSWLGPNGENADVLPGNEISAGWHCRAWLADNAKKALLAQVGVGTIDQALMAVLTTKHQSLRLIGLFGKVLVVDEVHANDAYMHSVLKILLEFHAQSGGNVILLSATLPRKMRQELADSFMRGAGYTSSALPYTEHPYPLLTRIDAHSVVEIPVKTRHDRQRTVAATRIGSLEEMIQKILEAAASGACVAWVRNTVADAREGFQLLGQRWPKDRLTLFHARFAMGDRLEIEQQMVACFGRNSGPEQRRGRIVVATQVVEQSLDLDFDWLATDLAPIDLLIQRAGRLHRHRRMADGTPSNGPEQRQEPILWWFGPEAMDLPTSQWIKEPLPGTAAVYPDHGKLWRSARLLQRFAGFTLPTQARALIEGVYGEAAEAIPPGLSACTDRAAGERQAQSAQARFNTLKLADGYVATPHLWSDEGVIPTRLGDPVCTVRLLRWQDGQALPWYTTGSDVWSDSQLRIRQVYAAESDESAWDADLTAAVAGWRQRWPDQGRWVVVLPLTAAGAGWWQGTVRDNNRQQAVLFYHSCWGLVREEERSTMTKGE
ncbi:MAG: CRISPR-associated helicase Cas3', partial [Magnetococcales bacterium]|nr:CRISPR-associated helicase Cas3' [Magnetococcales bacterium]